MLRPPILALTMLLATLACGCDEVRGVLEHPTLRPHARPAVLPTAPPREQLTLVVAGERELGPLARNLGTTVEELVRDNALVPAKPLSDGQVLRVRSSRVALDGYLSRRAERAALRAEREAKAEAAKAAGKQPKRKRRRKSRRRSR